MPPTLQPAKSEVCLYGEVIVIVGAWNQTRRGSRPTRLPSFNALPADGSAVSNPSLRRYLRWTNDRYFAARDALVDKSWKRSPSGKGHWLRWCGRTKV